MTFDELYNMLMEDIANQSQPQGNETPKSLMKQAAILRAQAQSLNDGSSMYDTRKVISQSPAAKNAVAQKIKQAKELEAKAKAMNPNIQQTNSIPLPPKNLPTPPLAMNY